MNTFGFEYLSNIDKDDKVNEVINAAAHSVQAEDEEVFKSNENGLGLPSRESSGTYNPQKLNARHREIIRLVALGYKNVTVAGILGITPETVSYVINSPLGQSFLQEIEEARTSSVKDTHKRLQEMSPLAAEVMLDIMNEGKSESNRLKAAEKVLEMTGHKGENKHMHLHTHLGADDIKAIKAQVNGGPEVVPEETDYVEVEEDK